MRAAIIAALSTIALTPSAAFAQQACEQHNNQVAGTIFGTVAGAALGSAIAGHGHKDDGALVGALGGAILGNQLSKPRTVDCAHAYGFYDNNGAWHANPVDRTVATGYYDRAGRWVEGEPNGYYDVTGKWVVAQSAQRQGYYDNTGHWVPPAVDGYYDTGNRWVTVVDRGPPPRDDWNNYPRDTIARADWIRERINRAEDEGRISHREARNLMDDLQAIKVREARMSHRGGGLNYRDEQIIQAQLDNLSADLRRDMRA